MAFNSGRVSFVRLAVSGDAPSAVDDSLLSTLAEHAFKEHAIGAPEEVEAGFVTGAHLFDTAFDYEKNGYGPRLLFALRIDTHKVPADVKRAYRLINEQAAADANPSGYATRGQKREAAELADRQMHEDLASGKFRRSKLVPVLWDLSAQTVYSGSGGQSVTEALARCMREAFGVELSPLTAGARAGQHLRGLGRGRDYEDLLPSAFTTPPAKARADLDEEGLPHHDVELPVVPWTLKAVDEKDFLGNELLIWLWWRIEAMDGAIAIETPAGRRDVSVAFDRVLDMDCAWGVTGRQSLRGDGPTRWREAAEALAIGKWPRKAGLLLSDGEQPWELTLAGETLAVTGARLPEIDQAESPRELTEARLERIVTLGQVLDGLYEAFLAERSGTAWPGRRRAIRQWVQARRRESASSGPTKHAGSGGVSSESPSPSRSEPVERDGAMTGTDASPLRLTS